MAQYKSGIEKLAQRNRDNLELMICIQHYHLNDGSPAPGNWRRQQYIIAMISSFTDLNWFNREKQEGFAYFTSATRR